MNKVDKNNPLPQAACPELNLRALHCFPIMHRAPFSLQLSTSGLGGKRSVVSGLNALISRLKRRKDG